MSMAMTSSWSRFAGKMPSKCSAFCCASVLIRRNRTLGRRAPSFSRTFIIGLASSPGTPDVPTRMRRNGRKPKNYFAK